MLLPAREKSEIAVLFFVRVSREVIVNRGLSRSEIVSRSGIVSNSENVRGFLYFLNHRIFRIVSRSENVRGHQYMVRISLNPGQILL